MKEDLIKHFMSKVIKRASINIRISYKNNVKNNITVISALTHLIGKLYL